MPAAVRSRIAAALHDARSNEIGGVLMGERLDDNRYKIVDVSIQTRGGLLASFVRQLAAAMDALTTFFSRTLRDYRRFNYLGEWHSHPSFAPVPSRSDEQSMREIVNDPEVGATFAVLLIVKLKPDETFDATVTVFAPNTLPFRAALLIEEGALH